MICCDCEWRGCGSADVDVWRLSDLGDPIKLKAVSVPLATLMQTSLGLYQSPTGPGR